LLIAFFDGGQAVPVALARHKLPRETFGGILFSVDGKCMLAEERR
jgi:hypothetical protein